MLDPITLAVIGAMAAVTYATRLGGFIAATRLRSGPRAKHVLDQLPGATFAAMAAPLVVEGGPPEWVAAAATVLTMRATGNILLAIAAGTAIVAAGRALAS